MYRAIVFASIALFLGLVVVEALALRTADENRIKPSTAEEALTQLWDDTKAAPKNARIVYDSFFGASSSK